MKKKIFAVLLAAMLVTSMTACGKKEENVTPEPTPEQSESQPAETPEAPESQEPAGEATKADTMADSILAAVTMEDGMKKVESERGADNAYPGIADVSDEYAIYINGTGAFAEEIAVIKVKDGSSVEDVEKLINTRVEFQKTTFENYRPDEMVKLGSPVIKDNGDYVVLVIANDSAEATTAIDAVL